MASAGVVTRTGWPRIAVVAVGYAIAVAIVVVLVVLLAGRIAAEARLLAEGGPDAFVVRPFVREVLANVVERALFKRP